jgi:lysophospholipase L1-like esterase
VAFNVPTLLVALLLVLEVRQRWALKSAERNNPLIRSSRQRVATASSGNHQSLWRADVHRYRPGASLSLVMEGQTLEVSINEHGLRGPSCAVPKPEGVFRIVCLGGSTTVEGPRDDATYPALLERRLRDHFGNNQIEVLNGGVSGLCFVDEVDRLRELLPLQPDLVVEYNAVNDICWSIIPDYQAGAPWWRKALRRSRYLALNWESLVRPTGPVTEETWQRRVFSNLASIRQIGRDHRLPVLFCSFCRPAPEEATRVQREYFEYDLRTNWSCPFTSFDEYCRLVDSYNARLKSWCRTGEYVPVAERVRGNPEYFSDICHMQPPGIAAKADAVFLRVRDVIDSRR